MIYNLSTKTILITGANSGIGKAASIQLAGMGPHVVMMCRSKERGEQALQDVTGGYWHAPNTPVKANKNAYNRELNNDYGIVQSSLLPSKERISQ